MNIPTYEKNGVIHYSVANMPSAVPYTSTHALEATTLPYAVKLAARGLNALRDDSELLLGLNTFNGNVTCGPVAKSTGFEYVEPIKALSI